MLSVLRWQHSPGLLRLNVQEALAAVMVVSLPWRCIREEVCLGWVLGYQTTPVTHTSRGWRENAAQHESSNKCKMMQRGAHEVQPHNATSTLTGFVGVPRMARNTRRGRDNLVLRRRHLISTLCSSSLRAARLYRKMLSSGYRPSLGSTASELHANAFR